MDFKLGDIIYTYYKLKNIINDGYTINIHSVGSYPQRAHQIDGLLNGISNFNYIYGIEQYKYRMIDPIDLFNPIKESLYENMPVLHINSFLESGKHINEFLSKYPAIYDIDFNISEISKEYVNKTIDNNYYNIILYCSNYTNNKNCRMHPNPQFWSDLCDLIYKWRAPGKNLKIHVIGAQYDSDLTNDVYNEIKNRNINCSLYLDNKLDFVIEMTRNSDFCICYESGWGMLSDVVKTPCLEIFRYQGPPRDDKLFPYLGVINPEAFIDRFFPMFYDDTLEDIKKKLDKI